MTRDEYQVLFQRCIYCGTDTRLLMNGVPVCLSCGEELKACRIPPYRDQARPAKQYGAAWAKSRMARPGRN